MNSWVPQDLFPQTNFLVYYSTDGCSLCIYIYIYMVVHIYHQSISWDNMVLGWRGIIYHWGAPIGWSDLTLFSIFEKKWHISADEKKMLEFSFQKNRRISQHMLQSFNFQKFTGSLKAFIFFTFLFVKALLILEFKSFWSAQ